MDSNEPEFPIEPAGLPKPTDELSLSQRTRKQAASSTKASTWLIGGGAVTILIAVLVLVAFYSTRPNPPAKTLITTDVTPRDNVDDKKPVDVRVAATPAVLGSEKLAEIEKSVVVLQTSDLDGSQSLGSGFVVSDSGLIATNYHVIASAARSRAVFAGGAHYEVEGYVAVSPENDLAILKLRNPPDNLKPLPLVTTEKIDSLSAIVAIGHPAGIAFSPFDGRVSRLVQSTDLSRDSQRFLRRHMRTERDHLWVQHTARLTEGNSGGPLVNDQGEVVGVNTWVDRRTSFSYALHVGYLRSLLANQLAEVASLERFADPPARAAVASQRLQSKEIEQLFNDAEEFDWRPTTTLDYEILQQLAWALTVARLSPQAFGANPLADEEAFETTRLAADRIETRLQKKAWDEFGQATLINELAVDHINTAWSGVFFFGKVDRVVTGDAGARGAIIRLAGFDHQVFVRLDGLLANPPADSLVLVMGVNNGQVARFGDNPLRLTIAPEVSAGFFLELD